MDRPDRALADAARDLALRARRAVPWSLPAWKHPLPRARATAAWSEAARSRLDELGRRYDLAPWDRVCGAQDWVESAYVLDLLDTCLPADLPPGRALDVGAKNGAYLPGLATAAARGWDAVEIDAHRRYLWGSTRRVYGEAMAAAFPGCRFVAGDVRELDGPWALVTWLLPFLTPAPLVAWGLPERLLRPAELLEHVWARIVPGGALLVVNQGEDEHRLQLELLAGRGTSLGRLSGPLCPFRMPRYAVLARATGPASP